MMEMPRRYMGSSVPRKEDPTLLTGHSNFTDDSRLPGNCPGPRCIRRGRTQGRKPFCEK